MKLIGPSPAPTSARSASCWRRRSSTTTSSFGRVGERRHPQGQPAGQVPCLVMEGGGRSSTRASSSSTSTRCRRWARLIPSAARACRGAHLGGAGDGLLDAAILARLEQNWPGRTAMQRSAAWTDRQLGRVNSALAAMSGEPGRQDLVQRQPPVARADIAVGCALGCLDFRFPGIDWRGAHPNLLRLYRQAGGPAGFIDPSRRAPEAPRRRVAPPLYCCTAPICSGLRALYKFR